MKKLFILITGFFLISCVASGPYKFAVFWDSIRDPESDTRYGKFFWVIADGLKSSLVPTSEENIEIPKLTRLKYLRKGLLRRMVDNNIEVFSVIEFQVVELSPLTQGRYKALTEKINKNKPLYVEFKGQDSELSKEFEKYFLDFDPVYMYRLTTEDIEKIATKNIEVNDRELLLHLTYGTPRKVVKELISGVTYRRYYYPGAGFFYVVNEIIVKKGMTQLRVE